MASFTDSTLPVFNPYVQQMPVEAALQVGLQKQAQYNQGVERIQAQIDNVAGMDIVRDVDKQYLQSKLNQLGGDIKNVAAGDFSNFQLTNTVGGMISRIGKDSNIQNAVVSTIRYRKGLADMEAAKKEGKSSPSNEWDFMRQAAGWLNSPDIKAKFEGGYNPYTNYKKNALEVIKSLTKDSTITDDAFTFDANGKMVITDAVVRKKFAGISPDKIQQALMAALTPADFKQMEIDGRYTYANADPRRLAQSINSSYSSQLDFYNKQKKILETAKSSTTSNLEKSKLDEQIAALNKVIGKVSSEYSGMRDMIAMGDIEAVKAQLHSTNFLNNFSNAFSFTETAQTYESSPLAQMAMQRANKEQDWKKFLLTMEWDKEKFALSFSQKQRELAQKDKELSGYGGLPQGISQDEIPTFTLGQIIKETEDADNNIKQSDEAFINRQGKDKEWLEAQRAAWLRSPNTVDPKVADHFSTTEEMRRRSDANKTMISEVTKMANEKFGSLEDKIPSDAPDYIHVLPSGATLVFTPEDFVKANEAIREYLIVGGTGSSESTSSYDLERAKDELSPKEFYILQLKAKAIRPTSESNSLLKQLDHYNKTVNAPFVEQSDKIKKFTTEEITKRITVNQGVSYGVPTENEAQKSTISTVLSQFADLADSQKGGLPNSPNFDSEAARKIATSNDVTYALTVVEGTEFQPKMYKMSVSGKVGGETTTTEFRITPEQKQAVFGDMFEAAPAVQAFRPYQEQIRKMGGYSTALASGTSSHENAYLSSLDFPSVKVYGVKANIEQPSPGKYSIRISAFDPIKKQWFDDISYPRNSLVREDQVVPLLHSLNDAAVFELLNDTAPTDQDLKRIKEASKKPL